LLRIFQAECKRENIRSSPEVSERALSVLKKQKALANFGNAGAVKNLLKTSVSRAVNRLRVASSQSAASASPPASTDLTLDPDDVEPVPKSDSTDPLEELRAL
jgi:hypothetical protein